MKYFIQRKKILLNFVLGSLASVFIFSFVLTAVSVYAQESCETVQGRGGIILQVQIPGVTEKCVKDKVAQYKDGRIIYDQKEFYYVNSLQEYIVRLYKFFIGLVAFAAVFMLMIGGAQYILAGGNPNKVSTAKSIISGALGGLFLALTSYVLLATINPRIVSLQIEEGPDVNEIVRGLFCENIDEIPDTRADFLAKNDLETWKKADPNRRNQLERVKSKTECGLSYYIRERDKKGKIVKDFDEVTNFCLGTDCPDKKICFKGDCVEVSVYGTHDITGEKYISGPLKLMAVCKGDYTKRGYISGNRKYPDEIITDDIWVVTINKVDLDKNSLKYSFPKFTQQNLIDKCKNTTELKEWAGITTGAITDIKNVNVQHLFFMGEVNDRLDRDDWYAFAKPCDRQQPFVVTYEVRGVNPRTEEVDNPNDISFKGFFDNFYNKNKDKLFISVGDSTSGADIKFDSSGNIVSPFKCDITLSSKFDR